MARATQAARVHAALRADILAGHVQPGEKLPFAELCSRYSSSVGVLREALSRLCSQGLVVNEPQFGFRVVPLSVDDLAQLTEARLFVEGHVLRLAVEHGVVEWEAAVVGAFHTLDRTPATVADEPQRMSEQWAVAHARFHAMCLQACPNRRLLDVAEGLRDSADLYRRWSVPVAGDRRDVAAEHRLVLEAILARDADAAVSALSEHLLHTRRLLDPAAEPAALR